MANLMKCGRVLTDKQHRETIAFALAPDKHISATEINKLLLLDRECVIRRLREAGALPLARKLEEEPKRSSEGQ